MLTNDIVSFEQLGPGKELLSFSTVHNTAANKFAKSASTLSDQVNELDSFSVLTIVAASKFARIASLQLY